MSFVKGFLGKVVFGQEKGVGGKRWRGRWGQRSIES